MAIRDQLMSALSQYGQSLALPVMPRDQEQMFDLYANRPDFAANYYPALESQQRIGLATRQENRLQGQQDALSQLAQRLGGGGFGTRDALAALAVAQGDPTALINYQIQEEEKARQLQKQQQIQSIIGGGAVGINPAASVGVGGQIPLSVLNKNAGNLRDTRTGEFRKFNTPQEGIEAMARDLTAKVMGRSPAMIAQHGQGYVPSLTNILTTYAPPSENDTQGYIDFVSKQTGIDPNVPLSPMDISRIMPAMIKMEGGQVGADYFGGAIPQPAPQPEIPTTAPDAPQVPPALEQLGIMAQIDPATYGDDYLKAKLAYEQEQAKEPIEADKRKAEINKTLTEGERDLRKEFEGLPDVKQFRDVEASYKRIQKATSENTGASDIALIFNYMKMLDPGSTVREGEFATAQNSGGIPAMVTAAYNQAIDGQRLTPDQRTNFLSQATQQYQGASELFTQRAQQYKELATQYGFKPERIVQGERGGAKITENKKIRKYNPQTGKIE